MGPDARQAARALAGRGTTALYRAVTARRQQYSACPLVSDAAADPPAGDGVDAERSSFETFRRLLRPPAQAPQYSL